MLIVCSALMIWKGLMVVTGSDSPVVVVLSGSMEPTMYKGDILFLNMGSEPFRVGEIVVFKIEGRNIPIVHRILEVHEDAKGEQRILTKGDNNDGFDRPLYQASYNPRVAPTMWLKREQVLGRAVGFLPYIGHLTIVMTEYPMLKYLMLSVMAFFVLTAKE